MLLTRYVSLGSVVSCVIYPFLFLWRYPQDNRIMMTIMAFCLAGLAIGMHRTNIKRLLQGTERKFSFHKHKKTE